MQFTLSNARFVRISVQIPKVISSQRLWWVLPSTSMKKMSCGASERERRFRLWERGFLVKARSLKGDYFRQRSLLFADKLIQTTPNSIDTRASEPLQALDRRYPEVSLIKEPTIPE